MARGADGPLVCPRCELDFSPPVDRHDAISGNVPADSGIALDSLDHQSAEWSPHADAAQQEQLRQQLRRIASKLGPLRREHFRRENQPHQRHGAMRIDWSHGSSAARTAAEPEISHSGMAAMAFHASRQPSQTPRTMATWAMSLLLLCGLAGFAGGVGLLAWSTARLHGAAWQWGITTTIAAQGLLIVGLVWMAWRLWRNGRRVNYQLQRVGRQLEQIEYLTGTLADKRATSSGAYYDHFAQGASSHMLLANLRGQLEQLAARMMA